MTPPKTILELAALPDIEINAHDLYTDGIHKGEEQENARLMPIIQAQDERIKALRAAVKSECRCGPSGFAYDDDITNCRACRTIAADDAAEARILEGE